MFQSTSVIADGRIGAGATVCREVGGFNPRPSLLTDESPRFRRESGRVELVSIHVRHC